MKLRREIGIVLRNVSRKSNPSASSYVRYNETIAHDAQPNRKIFDESSVNGGDIEKAIEKRSVYLVLCWSWATAARGFHIEREAESRANGRSRGTGEGRIGEAEQR